MDTVWIAHPNLDGKTEVPLSSLAQHQRGGWEQTDPPPPPPLPDPDPDPDNNPAKTPEAPAAAGASAFQQDVSPSRRRATTRGDE